ncbi:putative Proteasome subunit beta type-6 [Cocos nucifera]|uniref:Putative Proteasome subunit beta type-6 n=1 Tax=Cocos nucifera TaxID=13894 RepID=A0A8K0MUD7_COCNU|nr:putative Proteasome subunit beta type-6 [Cocos nucifera]
MQKFVVKAVSLAMARDGGGDVRTVIINADVVTRNFYTGDSPPLWREGLEPHSSLLGQAVLSR